MLKKELKEIKDIIKDLKDSQKDVKNNIKRIVQDYNTQIKQYDKNNWVDKNVIESLEKQQQKAIYNTYDTYSNDSSIHIIYKDGSEICTTGLEIVSNENIPKLTNIVYAKYMDGDIEFDTEIGEFNFDISIDEELEKREKYLNSIEVKFGTEWGKKHTNDYLELA